MHSFYYLLVLILLSSSTLTVSSKRPFFNSISKVKKTAKARSTLVQKESPVNYDSFTLEELIQKGPKQSPKRKLQIMKMVGNLFKSKAEKEADAIRLATSQMNRKLNRLGSQNSLGNFLNNDLYSATQELQKIMDRYADLDEQIERIMGDGSNELLRIC